MPVDFREYFWGEGNNGFEVLCQNMKYGQVASKELADFFRDRSTIEDTHSKLLAKLSKHANNCCTQGTFGPLWQLLRASSDKLATLHSQMVQRFQELVKDVTKYYEDQHRKHKQVKEEEISTQEVVQSIQHTTISLQKAKESYTSKFIEYEKLKRENGSPKEVEKAEYKYKKACEEYRTYLDKYGIVRNEFEMKMMRSCEHFQKIEEDHLTQMKEFLSNYSHILESGHALIEQVYQEFRQQCNSMDVDTLLRQFVTSKSTGTQKPGPLVFEEVDVNSLIHIVPSNEVRSEEKSNKREALKHEMWNSWSSGFLKSKRERKKEKNKKKNKANKEESIEKVSAVEEKTVADADQSFQVDEDGYRIRPEQPHKAPDKESFDSSSDADSDEEEKEPRIHIQIKPLTNGAPMSASVDELRATIGTITLSPLTQHSNRRVANSSASTPEDGPTTKRSISTSQSMSPSASSASTPTGVQSPVSIGGHSTPVDRYADLSELFSDASGATRTNTPSSEISKSGTAPINGSSLTTNGSRGGTPTNFLSGPTHLPRPASQRTLEGTRGRISPLIANMTRTESLGSLTDFKAVPASMGSSRGPSPLTIGHSDSVPLAVAFQEVAHAYFRGTDETKCQVRLVGDMKVSFPAGIVQVLATNPSPAPLVFHVNRTSRMEKVLPNLQLLTSKDTTSPDQLLYEFNMSALTALLRKQYELSPTASYFNIDILKYQIKSGPGARSTPLHLVAYWKCESCTTDLRIDYKFNGAALTPPIPLVGLSIGVPVDGEVSDMQARPPATWNVEQQRATWKLPELSHLSEGGGLGSLRARFELARGPSTPSPLSAQFLCQGASLSGADFELVGPGYRLSLLKKQVVSGKYVCEPEVST